MPLFFYPGNQRKPSLPLTKTASTRLRSGISVLLPLMALIMFCHQPVRWDEMNQRTVEENLLALTTAEHIYLQHLNTGDLATAAREAAITLQNSPGVDTVIISPDSSVWAYFTNGLIAGICEQTLGTTARNHRPAPLPVLTTSGGAVGPEPEILVPFADELPGTALAATAVLTTCQNTYTLRTARLWQNSDVTVLRVKNLLQDAHSLLYWTGHGTLISPVPGELPAAALVTGRPYNRQEMAAAVAGELNEYARAGAGGPLIALTAHQGQFYPVILPAFITRYARFDKSEPMWKAMVYISACFSAYQPNPLLEQAFRNAGADLFCGYDWAVSDDFSCDLDTTFIKALADTCLPLEALTGIAQVTDPNPYFGRNASFRIRGDTLVMLRHILDVRCQGTPLRSCLVTATLGNHPNLQAPLAAPGDTGISRQITIGFPAAPGEYNIQQTDDAFLCFMDTEQGRIYWIAPGYVGVGGNITIHRITDDLITGHFSGVAGYWAPGSNPQTDPPAATINLTAGTIKHTGLRF